MKRDLHMKRDLYTYEDRPIYMRKEICHFGTACRRHLKMADRTRQFSLQNGCADSTTQKRAIYT